MMDSFPELKKLYLNPSMSDIILVVNGFQYPSHKFVLSAKSEVFKAMFYSIEWIESKAKEIQIKETTAEAFELMLKYVYSEEFVLDEEYDYEIAFNVYKIAHRFRFERLILIIEELLTQIVTKSTISNKLLYVFPKNGFDDWVLEEMNNLLIEPSVKATIDSIAPLYEFAILYDIFELKISCLKFLSDARNGHIIIGKQSFLCKSLDTMYALLEMMNKSVSQSVIISALRALREFKPYSDLKQFESLVNLNDCSIDDIKVLRNINLFSEEIFFEMLSNKCLKLIRNNELKSSKIIELNDENQVLKMENNDLSLKRKTLYDNYLRLKQVFAPFIRGETNLWVNDYNYLRNFSRTRLNYKPKPNIKFNF